MKTQLKTLFLAAFATSIFAAAPVQAAEPTASGLWQKQDEAGRPIGWFLFVERNGTYEGAIAKLFSRPGDEPNPICARCPSSYGCSPWSPGSSWWAQSASHWLYRSCSRDG